MHFTVLNLGIQVKIIILHDTEQQQAYNIHSVQHILCAVLTIMFHAELLTMS